MVAGNIYGGRLDDTFFSSSFPLFFATLDYFESGRIKMSLAMSMLAEKHPSNTRNGRRPFLTDQTYHQEKSLLINQRRNVVSSKIWSLVQHWFLYYMRATEWGLRVSQFSSNVAPNNRLCMAWGKLLPSVLLPSTCRFHFLSTQQIKS